MSLVIIREKNDNGNQNDLDESSTLNNTTHATNSMQDSSSSTETCQVSLSQGEKAETVTNATTIEDEDEWENVQEEDDGESDDVQGYDDGDEDVNYRLFEDDDDYNGFDGDEYDYDSITGSADLDQFMFEQGMKPWDSEDVEMARDFLNHSDDYY